MSANEEDIAQQVNDAAQQVKAIKLDQEDTNKKLGRALARTAEMFGAAADTLNEGFKLFLSDELTTLIEEYEPDYAANEPRHERIIVWLVKKYSWIVDAFEFDRDASNVEDLRMAVVARLDTAGEQIDSGRTEAKNNDVKSIKSQLKRNFGRTPWNIPLPEEKTSWGYHHNELGELLCPIGMDWFKESDKDLLLQVAGIDMDPDTYYTFMYSDLADPESLICGFMRGEILLLAYKTIFFGNPGKNATQTRTKSTNAKRNRLRKVNVESICYVATISRFCLSSEPTWGSSFDNEAFYFRLVEFLYDIPSITEPLLEWWNEQIFGHPELPTIASAIPSTKSLIKKKLATTSLPHSLNTVTPSTRRPADGHPSTTQSPTSASAVTSGPGTTATAMSATRKSLPVIDDEEEEEDDEDGSDSDDEDKQVPLQPHNPNILRTTRSVSPPSTDKDGSHAHKGKENNKTAGAETTTKGGKAKSANKRKQDSADSPALDGVPVQPRKTRKRA